MTDFTNIQLYGVDADGAAIYYDAWDGTTINTGELLDKDEVRGLQSAGWDGTTQPWIVPDK